MRWLLIGSLLLGGCLIALLVLYVTRSRAQRAVAESEQRYRALFRSSVVPTLLVEVDGHRIIDLNDPARQLCGSDPEDGHLHVDDIESDWVRTAVARVLESDTGSEPAFDDCWIERSGELRWTELRGNSVAVDGRECRLVSVRDTTELRAHEEARLREDKMESLGVLAGGIAHDFNNALASIVGHVELARNGDPGERREMLDSAEQAALHARNLTTQLLAFAKGGQPVRRMTDLKRLLRETVQLAGSGSRLRIDLDIPDDLWSSEIDSGQFAQVVSNLVINAQQASPEGGRLSIRASNLLGSPVTTSPKEKLPFVRIDIEDDGPGIPEAIRHRIFDPYFTTKEDGSGLGLASAFAICKRHGGTLTFDSREGNGTTFHAYFPASTRIMPAGDPEPVVEPKGAGSVLVLEDEPLVQNVLSLMLQRWGFSVVTVDDGRQAVECYVERLAAGAPFDLLIMDLTIPGGMGGRQAMAEILTHDPHARAIVASGYSDDPTMADFRAAGFQAALAKPFRLSDLAQAVNAVIRQDGSLLRTNEPES